MIKGVHCTIVVSKVKTDLLKQRKLQLDLNIQVKECTKSPETHVHDLNTNEAVLCHHKISNY